MENFLKMLKGSPSLIRVVPFAVFLALTACQGQFGEESRYWFYLLKTLVAIPMLLVVRPFIAELRWNLSWEAVVAGVIIVVLWVGLDGHYPTLHQIFVGRLCPWLRKVGLEGWCPSEEEAQFPWNPPGFFGANASLALVFVMARILGSTLVVPPLEEVFYRSFLYRYIAKANFEDVRLGAFLWMPFLVTSILFGVTHQEWLPGILCGFILQGLVCWKKRLGDALTAHAIANFLLGLWVVWRRAWHFW